jgi:hypothetical protein
MTMLSIVNTVQRRLGLSVSSTVAGNSDDTATQLLALLNHAGEELAEVCTWQALQKEATFTTLAAESQGAIATIAPGFAYIINQSIWNRTQRRPIPGAISSEEWQALKSSSMSGPVSQYRIRGGLLMLMPAPAAGESCAFEYKTLYWATDSTGATGKSAFTVDTDVSVLDEQLLTLSLTWRFKQAQGLDFATELQMFENRLTNAMGRDGGKPVLDMGASCGYGMPGVMVPDGSWSV